MSELLEFMPAPGVSRPGPPEDCFLGGGEMGERMRALDWSTTPLGPVARWPQSLRTTVSICLLSRFPILVWWGPELVMLYNDGFRPSLGQTKHPRALGQPGLECWTETAHITGPMLAGVIQSGEAIWAEDQIALLHRNGFTEECYFTYSHSPVRDESGGVGGVITVVSETTAQVVGARRLHTLRELEAATLETESAAETLAIAAGVLAKNPADLPFCRVFLIDGAEQPARRVGSNSAPADEDWIQPLARVAASGRAELVTELPAEIGPDLAGAALVLPLISAPGAPPTGFLVAGLSPQRPFDEGYRGFLDLVAASLSLSLTRTRAFEAERRRAEALAALARGKDEFLAMLAHELRNPLAPMRLAVSLLYPRLPDGDRGRRYLAILDRQTATLTRLVEDLLDVERIRRGNIELRRERLDVGSVVQRALEAARALIEPRRHEVSVILPTLALHVLGDVVRLEQIVINLLTNAAKYMEPGGRIDVTVALEGERVVLRVRDSGIGIAPEMLTRVFDLFEQGPRDLDRSQGGLGIGLTVVRNLVELHGGTIEAVSEGLGKGAELVVRLPLAAPAERDAAPLSIDRVREALPESASQRVLLVDDNLDAVETLGALLTDAGHVVIVAHDGPTALKLAEERPVDLILLDLGLPGMDGFEVARRLRQSGSVRAAVLVAVTGYGGDVDRARSKEAGFDLHMVKPVSIDALHEVMLRALHRRVG